MSLLRKPFSVSVNEKPCKQVHRFHLQKWFSPPSGKQKEAWRIFRLNKQKRRYARTENTRQAYHIYLFFSHPDYTVGFGIAPNPAQKRSRTLPPIGNFTLPWRNFIFSYYNTKTIWFQEFSHSIYQGRFSEKHPAPIRTCEKRLFLRTTEFFC